MPPRLVATDLDGTLLRSDGTIDDRTRRALAAIEAAGVALVICTARPPRWLRPVAQETGHRGLAVCANGGVVWDLHTESVVEEYPLAAEVAHEVVGRLRAALPLGAWAVERAGGFAHEPAYAPRWPVPDDTVVDAIDVLLSPATPPAVKLLLRYPELSADALLAHARDLIGDLVEVSHSSPSDSLLEISASGVSKASALAGVCAGLGIAGGDVIAFGDMPNDVPMLTWAGWGVAVANAHPEVIAAADEVTASNEDAGVAAVLERLLG
ncbi:MAG TPA: HAD family hydrolase [Solirubrobacteraceae bacterium]|nr:HAD family hydrolase [Solirubrobacteraceae bacterium]